MLFFFLSTKTILGLFFFQNEKEKGKAIIENHGCNNLPIVSSNIFQDHYKILKLSEYSNNNKYIFF